MNEPIASPLHTSMLTWLRLNIAVTVAGISITTAAGGLLFRAGSYMASQESTMASVTVANHQIDLRMDGLHDAIVDVDRRLNTITANDFEARREVDHDSASIAERVGVLEAQMKFVADRVQQNTVRK